jgi:hypothetical protein
MLAFADAPADTIDAAAFFTLSIIFWAHSITACTLLINESIVLNTPEITDPITPKASLILSVNGRHYIFVAIITET